MGPAVFVLRESTSHSMKQLRAGPTWGGRGSLPQERGQTGKRCIARMAKILGRRYTKDTILVEKVSF